MTRRREVQVRLHRLLPVLLLSGCASMQETFCGLVEADSYVLVSLAGCDTMRVSVDYDEAVDPGGLAAYAWPVPGDPAPAGSEGRGGDMPSAWIRDAVDAALAARGIRLDRERPDFIVSHSDPVRMRGTLELEFRDPASREVIWHGRIEDEAYPARNREGWERRIRAAVNRLLERFPPSPDVGEEHEEP